MENTSIIFAFIGGVVSFLSPCVLPLIPAFLAYLSGTSLAEAASQRKRIFFNSFFFVLGFSIVFAVLGVLLNTLLKGIVYDAQILLSRIGGSLVIFFGLYLMGLIPIPFLEREYKLSATKKFSSQYLTSLVFGSAFAAGWTPCVGAVLGGILGLAAAQPGTAFSLLFAYSVGLGIPFLAVGLFASRASVWILRWQHVIKYVNVAFGALLIALGVLVFTQSLNLLANFELLNRFLLR